MFKKYYWPAIKAQWPWLLGYVLIMLLVTLLSWIYSVPLAFFIDFVRFSILPVVIVALYRIFKTKKYLQLLAKVTINGQWQDLKAHDVIAQAYQHAFIQLIQEQQHFRQKIQLQQQQRHDYLETWSHELKTPLTALNVLAENQETIDSNVVHQQVQWANYQLNLLLNYERLADFHHDLQFKTINLKQIITQVLKQYATFFINKKITPTIDIPDDATLLTDSKWLSFIIGQLLINAIKYSQPNKKIIISWQDQQLTIKDQGIGIAPDELPRIFEPGFTGTNGRQQGDATGMGLYIVKTVTQQLHIKIAVASQLNKGTTITLTFPK